MGWSLLLLAAVSCGAVAAAACSNRPARAGFAILICVRSQVSHVQLTFSVEFVDATAKRFAVVLPFHVHADTLSSASWPPLLAKTAGYEGDGGGGGCRGGGDKAVKDGRRGGGAEEARRACALAFPAALSSAYLFGVDKRMRRNASTSFLTCLRRATPPSFR